METLTNIVGAQTNNLATSFISFIHRFAEIKSINHVDKTNKDKLQGELNDLFRMVKNCLYDIVSIVNNEEFEQIIGIIHQNLGQFQSFVINIFLEILNVQHINCQSETAKKRFNKLIEIFESILNSPPPRPAGFLFSLSSASVSPWTVSWFGVLGICFSDSLKIR